MIATVAHEHHARLMPHVDELAALGDLVGSTTGAELRPRLDAACEFLTGLLLTHMEAAERNYYPELERMLQNRHSMTPMRRDHAMIRELVAEVDRRRATLPAERLSARDAVSLRRAIFHLFATLKIHLAEEQLYADIAEHDMSPDAAAALVESMRHEGIGER